MDPFDGEAFEHLSRHRCSVIGPRCLLSSIHANMPVPELPYPMYTASLRGCVVTSTGFSRDQKATIQLKVERMGGVYANVLHEGVTHLVCEVSLSALLSLSVST